MLLLKNSNGNIQSENIPIKCLFHLVGDDPEILVAWYVRTAIFLAYKYI